MPLTIEFATNSCATACINMLSSERNAENAFISFCKQEMGSGDFLQKITAFIIFISGPPQSYTGWMNYGEEFAKFLVENGLGEVVTIPAKLNLKYHPTTTCQTWLWSPDQQACEAWWRAYQERAAVKKLRWKLPENTHPIQEIQEIVE